MPILALSLFIVFLIVATLGRVQGHYRRTGDHGIRRPAAGDRAIGYFSVMLCLLGGFTMFLAPMLVLTGRVRLLPILDRLPVHATGFVLAIVGAAVTLVAQRQMGNSWRIGVDKNEATALVTDRLFGLVRNPIYSGLGLFGVGFALLVPNVLVIAGFLLTFLGIELHVRRVEEPSLTATHGERYRAYASRTGRFVPSLGRRSHHP